MNPDDLLAIYDRQIRFESSDPLSERQAVPEDKPIVVRHVPLDPHARWGWITWSRLTEANADRAIAEQVAFFVERGRNFEWKRFGHDGPPDLDERLLRRGFNREEHESVMLLDLRAEHPSTPPAKQRAGSAQDDLGALVKQQAGSAQDDLGASAKQRAGSAQDDPGGMAEQRAGFVRDNQRTPEVEILRITDPADLDKVVQIEDAVWNESHAWIAEELRYELALPGEPLLMYLAYAEGVPAAAAWIRFHAGTDFAALFGGSTLPQYRKRGLYTALLNVRAEAARQRGYRFLSVDASEMSRPILEKHGFVKVTTATAYKYRLPGLTD